MTAIQMRDWFDILQDKYNTPYFTDAEKDEFINDAQWDYINEYLGDRETAPALGVNKTAVAAMATLIGTVDVAAGLTGLVPIATINTAIDTLFSSSNNAMIIPLAVQPSATGKPATWHNHNDIHKLEGNLYKAGTTAYPNYTIDHLGVTLYPREVYANVFITVLKEPITIDEMPASVHHKLIAKAMTKTGLVTENQAITLMEQTTNG